MPDEPRAETDDISADVPAPADVPAADTNYSVETGRPVSTGHSVETGYSESGVPTFDSVREKIETRYATSLGSAELAADTPEARTVEEQFEARQRAAAERLARIRESMHAGDEPQ